MPKKDWKWTVACLNRVFDIFSSEEKLVSFTNDTRSLK